MFGETTVIDVEVTDAMAHAWVEVYIEGFGWKVIEVTPGSNEVSDEDDFWSAFGDMLRGNNLQQGTSDGNGVFSNLSLSEYLWLVYVLVALLGGAMVLAMLRMVLRKLRRYARCHQKDEREAVVAQYADVCDRIRLCDPEGFNACKSHREQLQYMSARYCSISQSEQICRWLEQISYSPESVEPEQLAALRELMKRLRKALWKRANFGNRLRLLKR
jgi:hypothetical protein